MILGNAYMVGMGLCYIQYLASQTVIGTFQFSQVKIEYV